MGIATAGVEFYELILNDYFNNITAPPKYVLILLSTPTFAHVSDNFSAYPIHRYLEQPKSNLEIAFHFKRYNELFSMYKKSITKGFQNIMKRNSIFSNSKKSNNKGYLPSNDVVDNEVISKNEYLYLSFKNDKFNESKVERLLDIAANVENKGSKVIFFELPTNILVKYFSKSYISDYKKNRNEIEKKYEVISLDSSMFSSHNYRNTDHMNSSGANIATKYILKKIYESK